MIGILKAIRKILVEDTVLASMLSSYIFDDETGPEPAIFSEPVPADAKMPYLVADMDVATLEDNDAVDRLIYAIEAYVDVTDGEHTAADAHNIANRIEKLLSMQTPAAEDGRCLGIFRDNRLYVPDDEEVKHIHMDFVVRFVRTDLII